MSEYLGFVPEKLEKYFFVAYNSDDAQRVGEIVQRMHQRDIPLWYDFGIPYGDEWEEIISEKIDNSEAVILFFTKGIFLKEGSYVHTEYRLATEFFDKKVYVVMMDEIGNKDVPRKKAPWWIKVKGKHNIEVFKLYDPDAIASKIAEAIGMDICARKEKNSSAETWRLIDELKDCAAYEPPFMEAEEQLVNTSTGRMVLDNRYELIEVIGKGGFGEIYLAGDLTVPGRIVAVKYGGFTAPYIVRMHQYLIGKTNDNLCEIYGANITSKGESYVAMQLLNGRNSLASVKDYREFYEKLEDNYPVGAHISVLVDILWGVKCLHDMGIVHDDINPSNILTDGFVTKLIDYDGAFFLEDKENPDGVNTILVAGYRSPEREGERDFRSDIYSVGMVAYKWLTGNDPLLDEEGNLHLDIEHLDVDIKRILRKATALSPDDRYQSADEFIRDLRTYHKRYVEGYKEYSIMADYQNWLQGKINAAKERTQQEEKRFDDDVVEVAKELVAANMEYFRSDHLDKTMVDKAERRLTYSLCIDLQNMNGIYSDRLIVPEFYTYITSNAFANVGYPKIFLPKGITGIGDTCLLNLGYLVREIYIYADNKHYTIINNGKALLDVRDNKVYPVKKGVILKDYS